MGRSLGGGVICHKVGGCLLSGFCPFEVDFRNSRVFVISMVDPDGETKALKG